MTDARRPHFPWPFPAAPALRPSPAPAADVDMEPQDEPAPGTAEYTCQNKACGKLFTARTADRARGWARFCSKSCKAVKQEARTHQYRDYMQRDRNDKALTQQERDDQEGMNANEAGWDGHKQVMP
jgi:hypothetical protein